jgi:hypothetical protein
MLANAVKLCEARFGAMYFYEGEGFRFVAAHNAPAPDIAPRAPSLWCASHAAAPLAPSKGRPASSSRITCTADHLPPRAAGDPALLRGPLQWPAMT